MSAIPLARPSIIPPADNGAHAPLCGGCLPRRAVLAGAATFAGAATLAATRPSLAAPANPRRIDVHHHIIPPIYLERAKDRLLASAHSDPAPLLGWTPAKALEQMDKFGIATAMTSISTPGVWFGDRQAGRDLARACNEYAARMATDHPGRFGTLIALPLPDIDGSLAEIAYGFDTLHADGVCLLTSYDGKWPGDAAFAPVFDELNRRKAAVYFHPTAPSCCVNLVPDVPPPVVEFLFDSTRAMLSMMASGTFARCPDLRCVFAHTGGATADVAFRINAYFNRTPELLAKVPGGALATMRRQHFDIANSVNPATMAAALALWGPDHLVFGSDNPFVPISVTASAFDQFKIAPRDRAMIDRGTAAKLFPRFA